MTKFQTASIAVALTALGFISQQAFETKKKDILDSLALSVMTSLVEIEIAGMQTAGVEPAAAGILVADSTEPSPDRSTSETIATLVLPLPPLKPLPKPLCAVTPRVQLASYKPDAGRFRYDLFHAPEIHTEVRVITVDSAQTGDWATLIASCREKSLKVCIEKSKTRQRVVILDPERVEAAPSPLAESQQPVS